MSGIYVHVPFCHQACYYCNFHFSTSLQDIDCLVDCLCIELTLMRYYLRGECVDTVYFGGGTPSILNSDQLYKITQTIKANFDVSKNVEVTLEANPSDLTIDKLQSLLDIGVTRLSVGIQTFNEELLKTINRRSNVDYILRCIDNIKLVGFNNFNIDIIYGIPGQIYDDILADINQLIKIRPTHISTYSLTIEPNTVFGVWNKRKAIKPKDDVFMSNAFLMIDSELTQHEYLHYEISNYCLPRYKSMHNSNYWDTSNKYLGIGPGAHSYNLSSRQYNISNNQLYIKSICEGSVPSVVEILTNKDKINEYIMLGLRTMSGIDLNYISHEFKHNIDKTYIDSLVSANLCTINSDKLTLTPRGMLMVNDITSGMILYTS